MRRTVVRESSLLLIIIATLSASSSYRILCIFPHASKSHNIVFGALTRGLAKHGHRVDVISHYPLEKPLTNYNDIVNLSGLQSQSTNNVSVSEALNLAGDSVNFVAVNAGNRLCEFMGLEQMQKLVKNPPDDPPYDLVVTEAFGAHCYMGFGHVLKVPVVAVTSGLDYPWINYFTGNDDNLAYVPNVQYPGAGPMNFRERLTNFLINYYEILRFHWLTYETQTRLMRDYLHPDIPDVREVERRVALTLVNAHPILSGVKPIAPAFVQIAGVHIEMNEETLPTDFRRWMDESTHGVVYFSFGSKILLETLPEDRLRQVLSSFAKISPVRVLFKIVNCTNLPEALPNNVKSMIWIPQQPVLAHPNTKVFINHGGLGGVQEALYYGVPMIGIPLFGDQFRNIDYAVQKQMAIRIDLGDLTEESLDAALQALLYKPIYKEKAMLYSKLFKDQPISPMNNAIFWIEYVIRNGPDVLRSPALQLSFVELALLDVYGVLLLISILFLLTVFLFVKVLIKILQKGLAKLFKVKGD